MSKASRKARGSSMGKVSRKARGLRDRTRTSSPKSSAQLDRDAARLDREIDEALAQPLAKPKRPHKLGPTVKAAPLERDAAALPARKISLARGGRPPTSTSDIRSPTSTSTEVRSPTSTSTEVRSPTSTSTDAYTSGNVTVTGGAGRGATTSVKIYTTPTPKSGKEARRADSQAHGYRSRGSQNRMTDMIEATMAPRTPAPMPGIMRATGDRKTRGKHLRSDVETTKAPRTPAPMPGIVRATGDRKNRGKRLRGDGAFDGARWGQEPMDIAPKRPRLTYGKTSAQLDAEIAEALAGKKL